jgi:hypothetical protein
MKYENGKWLADTITVGRYSDSSFGLSSVEYYDNKCYALGVTYDNARHREIHYYFAGDINNWVAVDSFILDSKTHIEVKWGNQKLRIGKNGALYSYGAAGIWKYNNKQWEKIFNFYSYVREISAESKEYIIAACYMRKVYYYNGSIWEDISDLFKVEDPTFTFSNVWTDGKEIIIAGNGTVNRYDRTIIWHGK